MKKIILFFCCLFAVEICFASENKIILINNSQVGGMTIHYKVCPVNVAKDYGCEYSSVKELILKSKNYEVIPIDDRFWYVKIIDVVEKDAAEKIIAQGDFQFHLCEAYVDRTIVLDDFGTPFVTCLVGS